MLEFCIEIQFDMPIGWQKPSQTNIKDSFWKSHRDIAHFKIIEKRFFSLPNNRDYVSCNRMKQGLSFEK